MIDGKSVATKASHPQTGYAVSQVEVDGFQFKLTRLDLGEVEDVVDDGEQRLGGGLGQTGPETRVIYTSGDSDDTDARHDVLGHHAFLEKPFSSDDLMGKVREILDSPKRLAA
jgi:hypothetical protein